MGFESIAEAGFLKNGARPRSGDRLQTIKPPRPGAKKRLYAPGERPQTGRSGGTTRKGKRKQQHAWFWKSYSTASTAASPDRWGTAIDTFTKRRDQGKGLAARETLFAIEAAFEKQIAAAARRHKVSEALLMAVIYVESRGQPGAVSPKGAQGLMQLIPATAKRFGVTDAFSTTQNINAGAAYLSWLLREFRGDPLLALAGYNAGEGAVRKHKGVPPYAETRDYVVKVMDAVATLRPRCVGTLPDPRARCVLKDALG